MANGSVKLAATITQSCRFEQRPICQAVRLSLRAPKAPSNSATMSVEKAVVQARSRWPSVYHCQRHRAHSPMITLWLVSRVSGLSP